MLQQNEVSPKPIETPHFYQEIIVFFQEKRENDINNCQDKADSKDKC